MIVILKQFSSTFFLAWSILHILCNNGWGMKKIIQNQCDSFKIATQNDTIKNI